MLSSLPPLPLSADYKTLSSPNRPLPSTTPSWVKLLSIDNSAATTNSRRTGTNPTQEILDDSARAPEKNRRLKKICQKHQHLPRHTVQGCHCWTPQISHPHKGHMWTKTWQGGLKTQSNHRRSTSHKLTCQCRYQNWLPQDGQIGCQQHHLLSWRSICQLWHKYVYLQTHIPYPK